MAKSSRTYMPVDTPAEKGDGIVHDMHAFFAQEQQGRGFVAQAVNGDSKVGKGNGARPLGGPGLRTPKPLTGPGPFANLRGGNRRK